nr:hypothetical protein [Dyella sp. ASV24]
MVHNGVKPGPPPEAISLSDGPRRHVHRALKRHLNNFFLRTISLELPQLDVQSQQLLVKL